MAAFASWHARHDDARHALARRPRLVAHCAIELYSVLTRLPAPHRAAPHIVGSFIAGQFPDPYLVLPAGD